MWTFWTTVIFWAFYALRAERDLPYLNLLKLFVMRLL